MSLIFLTGSVRFINISISSGQYVSLRSLKLFLSPFVVSYFLFYFTGLSSMDTNLL